MLVFALLYLSPVGEKQTPKSKFNYRALLVGWFSFLLLVILDDGGKQTIPFFTT